jgi:Raf kinase inhibitor-like YbhB/YbcL family protein
MKSFTFRASVIGCAFLCAACSGQSTVPQGSAAGPMVATAGSPAGFSVSSTTFKNNKFVPKSMVYTGCKGGNMSPQLQWKGVPKKTKSFAIIMLDTTAIFWHWGMYNIAPTVTSIPPNAGTPISKYGKETLNDFAIYYGKKNRGYDGPCPPKGKTHHYVITLYALNTTLKLRPSAYAEDLNLAVKGHLTGITMITGLYKT